MPAGLHPKSVVESVLRRGRGEGHASSSVWGAPTEHPGQETAIWPFLSNTCDLQNVITGAVETGARQLQHRGTDEGCKVI